MQGPRSEAELTPRVANSFLPGAYAGCVDANGVTESVDGASPGKEIDAWGIL